jgi:hypothetical protein
MSLFGVRYWRVMFWLNIVLAVVHACHGNNMVFLSIGMAVVSKAMIHLLTHSTEN